MKNSSILFLLFLFFTLKIAAQTMIKDHPVSSSDVKEWMSFLASDDMKGRANGSAGMKTAAAWIEEQFRKYDIKPMYKKEGYFQNYTTTARGKSIDERNVIGILEGSDPQLKNQYIIISAHFDHIGISKRRVIEGDSICNGADDNAAGTCTMIGIAKTLKELGLKPGRSIIFAAFSGEELGLKGSKYFVSDPPVPLKDIYVNFNIEMTGHSGYLGKNKYYMTGCDYSDLDDIIKANNKQVQFVLIDTIKMAKQLFYGSDNISFSGISSTEGITTGIPSGTFATSTMESYLHTPKDDISLIDFDNMSGLVYHFSNIVFMLSHYEGEIKWTDSKFKRP